MILVYNLIILILLLVIFIYLSAWFSGTETALTHINTAQLAEMKEKKSKNIKYILKLKRKMNRTLVAILIGNNVVNIVLSSIAALIADTLFQKIGVTIMVGVITFLLVIFGEITPKSKALADSKKVAQKNAKKIYLFTKFLGPVITFFMYISRKVIELSGGRHRPVRLTVSDESIKGLASLGEEQGVLKKIERDLIHKVFHFGDSKIEEIMVPLKEVYCLSNTLTIKKAREEVVLHGFTRVPVVGKNKKILGILYSKDLMAKKDGPIKDLLRQPFEIYSSEDITDIFDSMELRRTHIAVVKDHKTGKQVGIVTLEDILEELVGEIHDEYTHLQDDNTKAS